MLFKELKCVERLTFLQLMPQKFSYLNQNIEISMYPFPQIIARVSVDNRTRALVQGLYRASDVKVYISRVEDLGYHLLQFPETCGIAVKVMTRAQALFFEKGSGD